MGQNERDYEDRDSMSVTAILVAVVRRLGVAGTVVAVIALTTLVNFMLAVLLDMLPLP